LRLRIGRMGAPGSHADRRGRPLADLRISVTDRCNFRCPYCMPRELFGADYPYLPRSGILTYEEIARLAACFVGLGVRKIRLTGGEPLLRRDLERLVASLRALAVDDLALTTNGALLAARAEALAAAGLGRVTVSLDSLDEAVFRRMSDVDVPVARVLEGIAAAERAGLSPIKINTVVQRGVNEASILPLLERFRGTGHVIRFIEYMDVGNSNAWRREDVVSGGEILAAIRERHAIEPLEPAYRGEVVRRWRLADGSAELGVITSVSAPFCGDCTRARLSADGHLFTCLFAARGTDLRPLVRSTISDDELRERIAGIWHGRDDRYSELRGALGGASHAEMSYLGG